MLVASVVFEEWKEYLGEMAKLPKEDPERLTGGIYSLLRRFADDNRVLFSDKEAARAAAVGPSERHAMLRDQISKSDRGLVRKQLFGVE